MKPIAIPLGALLGDNELVMMRFPRRPPTPDRFVLAVLRRGEIERWRVYKTWRMTMYHARRLKRARMLFWIERGGQFATVLG